MHTGAALFDRSLTTECPPARPPWPRGVSSSRNGHCVRSDMAPRPDAGAGDQVANSRRLINMDSSTKNKAKGSLNEAKGKIKEGTGKVTENRDLEERGVAEKTGGKVEKKVGDVKKVFNK
jgi:uncharacterized protein YjbJ (UPF0337 family)